MWSMLLCLLGVLLAKQTECQEVNGEDVFLDMSPIPTIPESEYRDKVNKLEKQLFTTYDSNVRPVKTADSSVEVRISVFVDHIEEVNEREQTMTLHGWMIASWKDEYLTWNPTAGDWKGVRFLWVNPWKTWRPDVSVFNSAAGEDTGFNTWGSSMNTLIRANGYVIRWYAFTSTITCSMDFADYPYDTQRCPMAISSWMNSVSELNITGGYVEQQISWGAQDNKMHVSGWRPRAPTYKVTYWDHEGCCKDKLPLDYQSEYTWSILFINITVDRHAPYVSATMVLPSVITSFVTLIVFWLESRTLVMVVMLANLVLQGIFMLNVVYEAPPATTSTPRTITFFGVNLMLTSLACIALAVIQQLQEWKLQLRLPSGLHHVLLVTVQRVGETKVRLWHEVDASSARQQPDDDMQKIVDTQENDETDSTDDINGAEFGGKIQADNRTDLRVLLHALKLLLFFVYFSVYFFCLICLFVPYLN